MKINLSSLRNIMLIITFICSSSIMAASQTTRPPESPQKISGIVKDASGEPLIGATILEEGTTNGVITDVSGKFTLSVKPKATLLARFIGYENSTIKIGEQSFFEIIMKTELQSIDEVVVVGYGTQQKATLTGAVSSIKSDEIVTTKNENLQNMLTGKIAGLRVLQNSSEPGTFNSSMDIRGFGTPLIVIDGVPRNNMARLDAEDIESVSVIKDGSGAVYGSRAANGVMIITTKKGSKTGEANISYSGNMTWQVPSNYPNLVGAADWMTLYNEGQKHNVDVSVTPKYTADEIESYRNGTKLSTNWKDAVLRKSAPEQQHTISATGGNDAVTYYASIGYQDQGSFLKTNAINYEKYTLRGNMSAKISKNLQFDLNMSGLLDERQSSPYGSNDIVRSMWLHRPLDKIYYDEEAKKYGMMDWNVIYNPVAMMDKDLVGENSYKSKWFQSSAALTYNVPFLKGLSLKSLYSYDYTLNDNKEYSKSFSLYEPSGKEDKVNTQKTYNNKISRFFYGKDANLWQFQIAYKHDFGNHSVSAMNLLENSRYRGDNFYGSRYLVLPLPQIFAGVSDLQEVAQSTDKGALYDYSNTASVGRATYDFKSKYLAEFSYRYEGSSKFPKNTRWGFFPSASAGWRISEENFWKNVSSLDFINNLKLRGSYGITGDDSALDYQFISGYKYPSSGSRTGLPAGYIFGNSFVSSSNSTGLANQAITWYKAKTFNIGLDATAWNGLLGATVEYFKRDRSGLLTTRVESLPGIVGANLPQENLDSDQTSGLELELSHNNKIGDVRYQIKGNISYTRNKMIYHEMARLGNSYLNWTSGVNDRNKNIWWGYSGNGRITNWNDIYYNPVYIARNSILGDYQYSDWNGDGYISDLDLHPLATNGQVPLINFGITMSAEWKGFDLTMLWQGAGKKYVIAREFLYQPLWSSTNAISDFMDRWHPIDPTADPYNPATEWVSGEYGYTGSSPNANSDFNVQNAAYLRLKTLEIGYTLPAKILNQINVKNIRIYGSAYNLLTFTKLRYMDPEFYTSNTSASGLTNLGYNYPINKTFSIGINVKF